MEKVVLVKTITEERIAYSAAAERMSRRSGGEGGGSSGRQAVDSGLFFAKSCSSDFAEIRQRASLLGPKASQGWT